MFAKSVVRTMTVVAGLSVLAAMTGIMPLVLMVMSQRGVALFSLSGI